MFFHQSHKGTKNEIQSKSFIKKKRHGNLTKKQEEDGKSISGE